MQSFAVCGTVCTGNFPQPHGPCQELNQRELRALPGRRSAPEQRLKLALKVLPRVFGLRCVTCRPADSGAISLGQGSRPEDGFREPDHDERHEEDRESKED